MIKRYRNAIAPANATFDLRASFLEARSNPQWISFAYWVDTTALLAGTFSMNITYVDPDDVTRVISGGGAVNLTIGKTLAGGFFSLPPQLILPKDATSLVQVKTVLVGSAFTSLISYRMLCTDTTDGEVGGWDSDD